MPNNESTRYAGQWNGLSEAGSFIIANIDHRKGHYSGHVSVNESIATDTDDLLIYTLSPLHAIAENQTLRGDVGHATVHGPDGILLTNDQISELSRRAPGYELAESTTFSATLLDERTMVARWFSRYRSGATRTDSVVLSRKRRSGSSVRHERMTWTEYKTHVSTLPRGYIFRGQPRRWSLETAFHRTKRADLISYLDAEVPELERYVNMFSQHLYDSRDDRSLGALLNLAQHHGYPTPLLDWSRSPYVAAYFAFADESKLKKDGAVSIFAFNEARWTSYAGSFAPLRTPRWTLRTLALPGHGNARVIPQQSVTMYSNAHDIEALIKQNEDEAGAFISAVAIPMSERATVMRDMDSMGITPGSLFPGLDGICSELRVKHFRT